LTTPDPDELLRQLDPGIAELKAKAELAQERIGASSATKQSSDRSVSVTVGPGGNLTGLNLTEQAYQRPPADLAAQIMQLAGQAQQQVGAEIMATFSGLVGPDSTAMSVLTPFLPPRPDDERDDRADGRPSAGEVEPDYDEGDIWK
jgi:YbaB/EbfC DNA-binding family